MFGLPGRSGRSWWGWAIGDKRDHAIKSRGSVFSALGFTVAEAEHLRIGSLIMDALIGEIENRKLTHKEAAQLLGTTRYRVSDLTRGRIDLFSIDALVDFLTSTGLKVDLRVTATPHIG